MYTDTNLDNIHEGIAEVAQKTAYDMKVGYILQNSRTGSVWHDMINEYRGNARGARVDSGRMINSVGSMSSMDIPSGTIEAEYGLRMPGAGGQEYFLEQEYGFDLELGSGQIREVPGMETYERTKKNMKSALRKAMLSRGFLTGKVDTRGVRILDRMKWGETFESAWSAAYGKEQNWESVQRAMRWAERDYNRAKAAEARIQARIEIAKANMIRAGKTPESHIRRFER